MCDCRYRKRHPLEDERDGLRLGRPRDREPRYQTVRLLSLNKGKDGLSSISQSNIEVEVRSGERKGHSPSWFEVLQLLGSGRNGKIKDVFL